MLEDMQSGQLSVSQSVRLCAELLQK